MTNWKENGVVPDSDDEDGLDSQSIASQEVASHEHVKDHDLRYSIPDGNDGEVGTGEEKPREEDSGQRDSGQEHSRHKEEHDDLEGSVDGVDPVNEVCPRGSPITSKGSSMPLIYRPGLLISSPNSPKPFKVPQVFWEAEDGASDASSNDELAPNPQNTHMQNDFSEEEISRSYVRVTSSTSSILSSPPDTVTDLPSFQLLTSFNGRDPDSRNFYKATSEITPLNENLLQEMHEQSMKFPKRSLRQRNPIQLHPYAMEQEKYRRTLKDRGIAPMRIAQSQDEMIWRSPGTDSPNAGSQKLDSQTRDSQDVEFEMDDSQSMDVVLDAVPLSFPAQPMESEKSDTSTSEGDDDFPDLQELFKMRPTVVGPKRRKKTYSSKTKRLRMSRLEHQLSAKSNLDEDVSYLDTPASPPPTSSPFPTAAYPSKPGAECSPSNELISSSLDQEEFGLQTKADLPTPATSAIKPPLDHLLSAFESDVEDPFVSDSDKALSEPSSDESIELRRVGRKIRGVLPASHLRLDQKGKTIKASSGTHRDSQSLSPAKILFRRGVAFPKLSRNARSPSASAARTFFLHDDSQEDENEYSGHGSIMGDDNRSDPESMLIQSRMGLAEEDNRIDAMLPSRKRHSTGSDYSRKKRRVAAGSTFQTGHNPKRLQPKISCHLRKLAKSNRSHAQPRRLGSSRRGTKIRHDGADPRHRMPKPPRLSILDVLNPPTTKTQPKFIRIACRAAKSRRGQGRQTISNKFIRLATREDTLDVEVVLQDWREGRTLPRHVEDQQHVNSFHTPGLPLQSIDNNLQTNFRPPVKTSGQIAKATLVSRGTLPRRLIISKSRQKSMNDFITSCQAPASMLVESSRKKSSSNAPRLQGRLRHDAALGRPAQLESNDMACSYHYPVNAFRTNKKILDTIYQATRKRPAPQTNLQLCRFLDNNEVLPSVEGAHGADNRSVSPIANYVSIAPPRRKKNLPQHLAAGAAMYRQPESHMMLEFLAPSLTNAPGEGNKLMDLGNFGTVYPQHFDIFPLRSGVFFHESTFIGGGRLSDALKNTQLVQNGNHRQPISVKLGNQEFLWGPWNETVSSEIGVCFDWLLESVFAGAATSSTSESADLVNVVRLILTYVQQHLSFTSSTGSSDFLLRMKIVLQDFSSGLNTKGKSVDHNVALRAIDVLQICALLVWQLLQLSRTRPEQISLTFGLEELLKNVTGCCISFLLSQGLDGVRKLYDDLQYLSFRENGIQPDQQVVQGWVIMIKVLERARIPRGSFWDLTNVKMIGIDVNTIDNARVMEKLWFSMFSLLPLFEIDEFGVVVQDQRYRIASDNWSLPQLLLKRVFAIYKSNARQSPNFNNYCRTIVSRCHYLMVDWGWWKCGGIVGTLFDFFASQNLAHLRNEEVYASPRYLQALHEDPSIAVEAEDRCFHIFLKIAAQSIKHLRQVDDLNSIRNLVARLLPNHDRQYPKDEAIHQRELASLRNHHDLLCTLYWSAPSEQRPSPMLIQELVDPVHSHKEACLINVRAWEYLARFLVATYTSSDEYEPLKTWQNTNFSKLLHQYVDSEPEIRRQADSLKSHEANLVTETSLQEIVLSHKRSTMGTLRALLAAIVSVIGVARSPSGLMAAFADRIVHQVLDVHAHVDPNLSECLLDSFSAIFRCYIRQVNGLRPLNIPVSGHGGSSTESDSQDSDDFSLNMDRWELTVNLGKVLPVFGSILKSILENGLAGPTAATLESLVEDWASLISLGVEMGTLKLKDFLVHGQNAIFQNRTRFKKSAFYWPLFLATLVKNIDLRSFDLPDFDIGRQWLILLTKPEMEQKHENRLTIELQQKGFGLCLESPSRPGNHLVSRTAVIHQLPSKTLIANAIKNMRNLLFGQTNTNSSFQQLAYSKTLEEVLDAVQYYLKQMLCNSEAHLGYVQFAQHVVAAIRAYGSDILTLPDFFVQTSEYYWSSHDDPNLFAAGIVSYSLALTTKHSDRTSSELFYYLYNGFKHGLASGRTKQHIAHIKRGMDSWHFAKFLLLQFLPAAVEVGFTSRAGWILCSTYLPVAAKRITKLLCKSDSSIASSVFESTINILRLIVNRLKSIQLTISRATGQFLYEQDSILAVVGEFWIALYPELYSHSMRTGVEATIIHNLSVSMHHFMRKVIQQNSPRLDSGDPFADDVQFEKGFFFDRFFKALTGDIEDNWRIDEQGGWVAVKGPGGGGFKRVSVSHHRPLVEVIKSYELIFQDVLEDGSSEFVSVVSRSGDVDKVPARFLRRLY